MAKIGYLRSPMPEGGEHWLVSATMIKGHQSVPE